MRNLTIRLVTALALITLTMTLTGCGEKLPADAQEALFSTFEPEEAPHIETVKRVEPLPEDLAVGAEEVWCVNLVYGCYSCSRLEILTCAGSRLVRRIDGKWQISLVMTEEAKEAWAARGCELAPETVLDD
jgi:hypothetical protein